LLNFLTTLLDGFLVCYFIFNSDFVAYLNSRKTRDDGLLLILNWWLKIECWCRTGVIRANCFSNSQRWYVEDGFDS